MLPLYNTTPYLKFNLRCYTFQKYIGTYVPRGVLRTQKISVLAPGLLTSETKSRNRENTKMRNREIGKCENAKSRNREIAKTRNWEIGKLRKCEIEKAKTRNWESEIEKSRKPKREIEKSISFPDLAFSLSRFRVFAFPISRFESERRKREMAASGHHIKQTSM